MCAVGRSLHAVMVVVASGIVAGCGSLQGADTSSASIHSASSSSRVLECAGEREALLEADLDPGAQGTPTEEAAAAELLSFYIDRDGGEMVMLRSDAYGMELNGRVVVVADVTPSPAGGFWVTTTHVCESFVPVETGPPETLATATTDPLATVIARPPADDRSIDATSRDRVVTLSYDRFADSERAMVARVLTQDGTVWTVVGYLATENSDTPGVFVDASRGNVFPDGVNIGPRDEFDATGLPPGSYVVCVYLAQAPGPDGQQPEICGELSVSES